MTTVNGALPLTSVSLPGELRRERMTLPLPSFTSTHEAPRNENARRDPPAGVGVAAGLLVPPWGAAGVGVTAALLPSLGVAAALLPPPWGRAGVGVTGASSCGASRGGGVSAAGSGAAAICCAVGPSGFATA